jgi:hypothetical protein
MPPHFCNLDEASSIITIPKTKASHLFGPLYGWADWVMFSSKAGKSSGGFADFLLLSSFCVM